MSSSRIDCESLRAQLLEAQQRSDEAWALKESAEQLTSDLQRSIAEKDSSSERLSKSYERQLADIRTEKNQLTLLCQKQRQQVIESQEQCSTLELQRLEISNQLDAAHEECRSQQEHIAQLEDEIMSERRKISELRDQLEDLSGAADASSQLLASQQRVAELESQITEYEQRCAGFEMELLKMQQSTESADLNEKLSAEQNRTLRLTEQLSSLSKEIDSLQQWQLTVKRLSDEIRSAAAKLFAEESSSEASFTCTKCMELFEDPMTMSCGHSCCSKCLQYNADRTTVQCPQCSIQSAPQPNQILQQLTTRFIYRKQSLQAVRTMIDTLADK